MKRYYEIYLQKFDFRVLSLIRYPKDFKALGLRIEKQSPFKVLKNENKVSERSMTIEAMKLLFLYFDN